MAKLLIIDDETTTRNGLMKHIKWEELGIHSIEEARDGLEGLEAAMRFQPDVILSDISMPGMNGIELGNAIKEHLPDCKLIFLSGYSDKEYLKAAIQLSAVNYIEKPINLSEVMGAVKKAVAMSAQEREKKLAENMMISALSESMPIIRHNAVNGLISENPDPETLRKDLSLAGVTLASGDVYAAVITQLSFPRDFSNGGIQVALSAFLESLEDRLDGRPHICASMDDRHIVAILSYSFSHDRSLPQLLFESMKAKARDMRPETAGLFMAVGQSVFGSDRIWQSYQTAEQALQKLFFLGYGNMSYYESSPAKPLALSEGISSYSTELLQQDVEGAEKFVENLCREISQHKDTNVDEVKNIFFKLAYALFREAENRGVRFSCEGDNKGMYLWSLISACETLQEIKEFIIGRIKVLFESIQEMDSSSKSIFDVMKYIQRHYTSCNLSNKALAEHVFLTPSYLSALFKKETGKTISEYIAEVRVEKSKELLKKPRVKLYEVAREVGYGDANYYAKVFRRMTGLTPSEFREKYKSC